MNQRAKDGILKAVNEYILDEDEEKVFYSIESIYESVMFFGIPK